MESSGNGESLKGMVRNRETEKYYKGDGQWTSEKSEAMQFENLSSVVQEAKRYGLERSCEFVIEIEGQVGFRVLLPL